MISLEKDDGNRDALNACLGGHENVSSPKQIVAFLALHNEFFKARVFLELFWEVDRLRQALEQLLDGMDQFHNFHAAELMWERYWKARAALEGK